MVDRWYITKEIPIVGVIAKILMVFIACYLLYILVFKCMIPNIKKKWPAMTSAERFRLIAKDILIFLGIIAGCALLVFLITNFKIDFSR